LHCGCAHFVGFAIVSSQAVQPVVQTGSRCFPAQGLPQSESEAHMLDLKSFHIVLMAAAIMLMSGLGVWGLLNDYELLGIISLAIGILLIPYGAYFAARFQRT
jgi:hypothetical protein